MGWGNLAWTEVASAAAFRRGRGQLLFNLQILRGVAALGVVFYHTDFRLPGDWHTEFFGVSTFFVISGFIMCFITRDDADGFLIKRLLRIVPLYWICTFALIYLIFRLSILDPSTWLTAPVWHPVEPVWYYVGRSLLFLPSEQPFPVPPVGWTLNFEMYFYVVFAAALLISRRLAPLIAAAFIYAVIWLDSVGLGGFLSHYYSHGYIHYFLYGIAVYYAWSLALPFLPRWPTIVSGAGVIAFCYGTQFAQPWLHGPAWTALLPYAPIIIVASALFLESSGAAVTWRPLVLIGDASYAIYLTHTLLPWMAHSYIEMWKLPTPKESTWMMLAYLAIGTAFGICVHLWIEKPLARHLRGVIKTCAQCHRPPCPVQAPTRL